MSTSCGRKPDLDGEWKITSVAGRMVQQSEASPSLSFDCSTQRIHGYTGVNILNGEFVQEGRKLTLSELGITKMAGPEEDMKLESDILEAFGKVYIIRRSDKGLLQFFDKDDNLVMTLKRKQQ